jgi:hypothetical protein
MKKFIAILSALITGGLALSMVSALPRPNNSFRENFEPIDLNKKIKKICPDITNPPKH